jgi:hypothetical protein
LTEGGFLEENARPGGNHAKRSWTSGFVRPHHCRVCSYRALHWQWSIVEGGRPILLLVNGQQKRGTCGKRSHRPNSGRGPWSNENSSRSACWDCDVRSLDVADRLRPTTNDSIRVCGGQSERDQDRSVVCQFRRENCVQEYEGLGFVQAQNLTPEQRDNLPPKPTR